MLQVIESSKPPVYKRDELLERELNIKKGPPLGYIQLEKKPLTDDTLKGATVQE